MCFSYLQKEVELFSRSLPKDFKINICTENSFLIVETLYKKKPSVLKRFRISSQAAENKRKLRNELEKSCVEARALYDFST